MSKAAFATSDVAYIERLGESVLDIVHRWQVGDINDHEFIRFIEDDAMTLRDAIENISSAADWEHATFTVLDDDDDVPQNEIVVDDNEPPFVVEAEDAASEDESERQNNVPPRSIEDVAYRALAYAVGFLVVYSGVRFFFGL